MTIGTAGLVDAVEQAARRRLSAVVGMLAAFGAALVAFAFGLGYCLRAVFLALVPLIGAPLAALVPGAVLVIAAAILAAMAARRLRPRKVPAAASPRPAPASAMSAAVDAAVDSAPDELSRNLFRAGRTIGAQTPPIAYLALLTAAGFIAGRTLPDR